MRQRNPLTPRQINSLVQGAIWVIIWSVVIGLVWSILESLITSAPWLFGPWLGG